MRRVKNHHYLLKLPHCDCLNCAWYVSCHGLLLRTTNTALWLLESNSHAHRNERVGTCKWGIPQNHRSGRLQHILFVMEIITIMSELDSYCNFYLNFGWMICSWNTQIDCNWLYCNILLQHGSVHWQQQSIDCLLRWQWELHAPFSLTGAYRCNDTPPTFGLWTMMQCSVLIREFWGCGREYD